MKGLAACGGEIGLELKIQSLLGPVPLPELWQRLQKRGGLGGAEGRKRRGRKRWRRKCWPKRTEGQGGDRERAWLAW